MKAIVVLIDILVLSILMLVPLARTLGLSTVELPGSAVAGWFLVSTPLALALCTLIGPLVGMNRFARPVFVQTTYFLCLIAALVCVAMTVDASTDASHAPTGAGAPVDVARMRSFGLTASAVFLMNLLALWAPFAHGVRRSRAGTDGHT